MMRSFLLYATIVLLLLNVFTYVYFNQQLKGFQHREKSLEKAYDHQKVALDDAIHFTLENNTNAQNYLGSVDYKSLISLVNNTLMDGNSQKGGNPYVDRESIDGQPFIMNKLQVLNDRWAIADFSNGNIWGNVLIEFFIDDKGKLVVIPFKSVLYPN
ncbi:MAG: hypothetical protein CFE24_02605 [Flavobacterium sp. BFFFF2]|nr:MAG: hypothetical protein CFE24_02605 [Flavobacterium sp. BFFFF2]